MKGLKSHQLQTLLLAAAASIARAAWPSCPGGYATPAPDKTFGIGGETDPYPDGAEACWLLNATGATHITIDFDLFHTEFGHDFLTVFDGENDDAGLGYSGELPDPFVLRSEHGAMLLRFKADDT